MKKLLVLLALIVTSCAPSNEEKAEKLIKETLKGYLYHPDSYEPLSTRVDSMFIDASAIEPIMEISDEIKDLIPKISKRKIDIIFAKASMEAGANYPSLFSREDYARAKKGIEEAESVLNKYTEKLSELMASLKENVAKYHKGEFTGWAVSHSFKSLSGDGSMTVFEERVFFCDEKFTTCSSYKIDEFEAFAKILKVVDEAISDENIINYLRENLL